MMSLSELEWWEHKHMEIEKVRFSLAFRSLLKSLRMPVIRVIAFHAPYKHHCHPASVTIFSLLSISELNQQRFILLLLLLLFFFKFCSRNPRGRNCLINKLHLCKKKKIPFLWQSLQTYRTSTCSADILRALENSKHSVIIHQPQASPQKPRSLANTRLICELEAIGSSFFVTLRCLWDLLT